MSKYVSRPVDERGAEQRHDRPIERRGEMARAAVGRHQQCGAADERLGQADRKRLVGKRDRRGPIRQSWRSARACSRFARAAQDQHAGAASIHEVLRQLGERFGRPVLRRTERGPWVQANQFRPIGEPKFLPDRVGSALVGGGGEQLHAVARPGTPRGLGQAIVVVDDRARLEFAGLARRGSIRGDRSAAARGHRAIKADAPPAAAEPGDQAGAKRVRKKHGKVDPLAPQFPGNGRPAARPGPARSRNRCASNHGDPSRTPATYGRHTPRMRRPA